MEKPDILEILPNGQVAIFTWVFRDPCVQEILDQTHDGTSGLAHIKSMKRSGRDELLSGAGRTISTTELNSYPTTVKSLSKGTEQESKNGGLRRLSSGRTIGYEDEGLPRMVRTLV